MEFGGVDISKAIAGMLQSAPLWAVALLLVKSWFDKRQKSDDETKLAIASVHEKLNRIEYKLAASGFEDFKVNIEKLKEAKVKHEMKFEAIFRVIDLLGNLNPMKKATDS